MSDAHFGSHVGPWPKLYTPSRESVETLIDAARQVVGAYRARDPDALKTAIEKLDKASSDPKLTDT